MDGPPAPLSMQLLDARHADAISTLWQSADGARLAAIGRPRAQRGADSVSEPSVLERAGAFGVGVFEGDELISLAIAMPARGDNGRSVVNVPGLAHISSVATLPQRWGGGIALHAMRAIRSLATRRGFARCQLWTHATNARAQALYRRDGFALSGKQAIDDFGEDIVHFVRELTVSDLVRRPAARVICLDSSDRVLLMHWRDPYDGYRLWEPPGGGIEPGETPEAAAVREWQEETALPTPTLGTDTLVGRDQLWASGRLVVDEVFYLGRLHTERPSPRAAAFTEVEQATYLGHAWLTRDQLATRVHDGDPIEPDLVPVLDRLLGS